MALCISHTMKATIDLVIRCRQVSAASSELLFDQIGPLPDVLDSLQNELFELDLIVRV